MPPLEAPPAPTTTPASTPAPDAGKPVQMPAPSGPPTTPEPDAFFNSLDDTPKPDAGAEGGATPDAGGKPAATPAQPGAKPKPAYKPGTPAPAAAKPAGATPALAPKELRTAYERSQSDLKTANAEKVRLLQQLDTIKAQGQANPAEMQALTERLAQRDKSYQELETELKFLRYEKSPEFKQKFLDPWDSAQKRAFATVKDMVVKTTTPEGAEGERPATANDFSDVFGLPEGAAWRRARQLFGDDAQVVMNHYHKLHEIRLASEEEITKFRTEGAEREKTDTARQATERQAFESMMRKADEGWKQRQKWFTPVESDDAGNAELQKGFSRVDADQSSMTPAQRVIHRAWVRNAAAAFPRLLSKMTDYESRIADLETKLKEFQDSGPGPGEEAAGGRPAQAGGQESDPMKELERRLG